VNRTTKKMQKEYKVDVGGFGNQLRIHYPKVWEKEKKDWDQKFSKVPIEYNVNVKIQDYGMVGTKKE
jgi:spore germination protein